MIWINGRRRVLSSSTIMSIVCNDCMKKKEAITSWRTIKREREEAIQLSKERKHRWYEANKQRILTLYRERREVEQAGHNHLCACGCGEQAIKTYKRGHHGKGRRKTWDMIIRRCYCQK